MTCGDIIRRNNVKWLLGYATTKLKIKEILIFEGEKYIIEGIQVIGNDKAKKLEKCHLVH